VKDVYGLCDRRDTVTVHTKACMFYDTGTVIKYLLISAICLLVE